MPQRYKLRLGDGTVLVVDESGLYTWQMDGKAMVQAAGGRWRPLKQILEMRSAAVKYAAQPEESSPRTPLPLVPPPPKRRRDAPPRESTPRREEPAPPEAAAPPEPAASSWADLVESLSPPQGVTAVTEEPPGPMAEEAPPQSTGDAGFPIFPSAPPEDQASPLPEGFSQGEPLGLSSSEPPDLRAWADEPPIASTESLPYRPPAEEEGPAIPPRPLDDEASERPELAWWRNDMEPPPVTARPNLQVLADDPAPHDGYAGEPPDDGPSVVPLKALDDRDDPYPRATTGRGIYEDDHDDFIERPRRGFVLDRRLVQAVDAFGAFLSWTFDHLERAYRRLRSVSSGARSPRRAAPTRVPEEPHPSREPLAGVQVLADEPAAHYGEDARPRAPAPEGPPVIRLAPLDDDRAPVRAARSFFRRVGSTASGWLSGLKGWTDRLARLARPAPAAPSGEVPGPAYPVPREPLKAPPSISELPVLRLAPIDEPREVEDLYEGPSGGVRFFPVAWLWTKRIVLTSGLTAGGVLAALNWEAWAPRAANFAGSALTELDTYMRVREQSARERRALLEATEQIPHLAPETIQLVMTGSATAALDPPEVFQRACDAADRGRSRLTPEEAQELEALRSTLLDTLSPAEGERVREYDGARSRRATFAFENRTALDLFARGARAMPAESLERLQALLGKAVAAGLASPAGAARGSTSRR